MRNLRNFVLLVAASAGTCVSVRAQIVPDAAASTAPATATKATPTLLFFSDFECPYSAETFKQIALLAKDKSLQVNIVYKETPLAMHPGAQLDALAALAAKRQGHYLEMAELLYTNQGAKSEEALASFARQLHLNEAQFRRDLHSPSVRAELDADLAESNALAIQQTPTLFADGTRLVGMQTVAAMETLLRPPTQPAPAAPVAASEATIDAKLTEAIETHTSHARGLSTAPVTVVEFTDFQCPFCRQAEEPMRQLMADRGRQVRWVFRSFPLNFHPDAEPAAEAAFAAGAQGRFWEMHDILFAHQDALKLDDLRRYALQLHLDMGRYDEAMRTHRYAGEVAADRDLGDKAGVSGTPTFVIDGDQVSGVRSVPELEQMVDASLARSAGRPARPATVVADASTAGAPHPVFGPTTGAPLVITWFTDVRSPLAARQATLIHMLTDHYDGKVSVLFKAFPLQSHPDAELASAALIAAQQQDKFWPMYDALSQERAAVDRTRVLSIASHLGLDLKHFIPDLDGAAPAVNADLDEAARRGVLGAPVIFLNQARVDGLQRDQFYTQIADRIVGIPSDPPAGN